MTITATSDVDDTVVGTAEVEVVDFFPINVTGLTVDPESATMVLGDTLSLTASVAPENADDTSVTWSSDNDAIATVDSNGIVRGVSVGQANIMAETTGGDFSDSAAITVETLTDPFVEFTDRNFYLSTDFSNTEALDVSANYHAGSGNTVVAGSTGGVKFWLRHMSSDWKVAINDYVAIDDSALGTVSGRASASINIEGATPTADLTNGEFYFLYITVSSSDGTTYDKGLNPVSIVDGNE